MEPEVGIHPIAAGNTQVSLSPVERPTSAAMNPTARQITILIVSAALVWLIPTSCGTIRGTGNDVKAAGYNIEESAH